MSGNFLGEAPRIRSFIRRQGRITPGQQDAIERLSHQYCLEQGTSIDFELAFGRRAPLYMEIGFGNGESLLAMAARYPENNYIGIEVHKPGVGHLLKRLEQKNIRNVRLFCCDAIEVLEQSIADAELAGVCLFFPDPWHKKRHHKRRIVRAEFLDLLAKKLKPGGIFHAATDWEDYAEYMLAMFNRNNAYKNKNPAGGFSARPDDRIVTKFERRGLRLGHGVWDIIFERV